MLFRFTDRLLCALAEAESDEAQELYQKWAGQFCDLGTPDLGPQEPYDWEQSVGPA